MFDGTDVVNDIDVRRQNLPVTIGLHSITSRNPSTPSPRPTTMSKGRSISSDIKKESTPANLKDIETLKLAHRHLDTRLHELESRVQYVNPWAVQHMWEVLMKLQERVFAGTNEAGSSHQHSSSSFPAAIFASPQHPAASTTRGQQHHRQRGQEDATTTNSLETNPMSPREIDAYRSCSPLTPNNAALATTFDVSMLMPTDAISSGSLAALSSSNGLLAARLQGNLLEEWMARQHCVVEESLQRNRLMVARATSAVAAASASSAAADVWASPVSRQEQRSRTVLSPTKTIGSGASGSLFRIDDEEDDVLLSSNSATFGRSQRRGSVSGSAVAPPPPPRLRSKFVEALITDKGFEERIKSMLADFVHPIVESSQKRFVSEAERWMQIHTGNIHHEFHEQMKTLTAEKDTASALIHDRIDAATSKINSVVTEAKSIVSDSVVTVNRLREDVVESSNAITLKLQRLDTFQQEMTRQVNIALDSRLSSLRSSLERIGDHQDLLHRRLDDLQTRHFAPHAGSDVLFDGMDQERGQDSKQRGVAADGFIMEQAVAYLDGMLLAPSSVAPDDDGIELPHRVAQDHHAQDTASSYNNRLSDSVLLHDLHNALHRMWSIVTHRGGGASTATAVLAVGIKDLVLRPVSLFPMHLVTSVVTAFLLRHNLYSLRSECARMKLPAHVARGLEIGWQWLASLSTGVLLRKSMTLFPSDDDPLHRATELDEDYANDMVLQTYGIPSNQQTTLPTIHASSGLIHGSSVMPSRSASRSRSPAVIPQPAPHQNSNATATRQYHPHDASQKHQAVSMDRHPLQHSKPSLEMLAFGGATESLHDDGGRFRQDHAHVIQRDSGAGTSFYTSIGAVSGRGGAALVESIDHSSFYGSGRVASRASGVAAGLVSSGARHQMPDTASACSSSRGSSRAPSPSVRKKLAFR
jgi:hypothetical protein